MKAKSRILSLALSVVMLAAMCFAIPVQLTAQASDEASITQVNFDWGASADLGDMHTVDVTDAASVDMPGAKPSGDANCAAGFDVSNLSGWKNGNKFFPVSDGSVSVADLQGVDGVATLTAVYGEYTNDYNGFTAFATPFSTSAAAIDSAGGKDDSVGVSLKVNSSATATDSGNFRQHVFHNVVSSNTTTPYYNLGASYVVTFDYKVVDVKGGTAEVNFIFGTVTPDKSKPLGAGTSTSWTNYVVRNNYVSAQKIFTVDAASDWQTYSGTLTAPDSYNLTEKSHDTVDKTAYGRGMGIGLTGTKDANIIIDNIKIVPIPSAEIVGYDLFVNSKEQQLIDEQGGYTMEPTSVVYKNNNGSQLTAFRFAAAFNYYEDGSGNLYLDEDKTIKILKRGIYAGVYRDGEYQQKDHTEADANAPSWDRYANTIEYTYKIYNISLKNMEVQYYATPYLIVEIDGAQQPIEGNPQITTVKDIYEKSNAKKNGYDWYSGLTVNETDFMHISFDDVKICFNNLKTKTTEYDSLWDEPFFCWLQELHDTYGAKFSLYAYSNALDGVLDGYSKDNAAKITADFTGASDWLKIGLHAEKASSDYSAYSEEQGRAAWEEFVADVYAITGTYDSIDTMPRLHTFAGSEDALKGMASVTGEDMPAATGFLSADDSRTSYYFTDEIRDYLYDNDHITDNKNGLVFLSTDLRGDWFGNFTTTNTYKKPIKDNVYDELVYRFTETSFADSRSSYIFFTHEWQVYNEENHELNANKTWVEHAVSFADKYKLRFAFPMNETFSETDFDINDQTPSEEETTTTRDGNTVYIVDNISDMEFEKGYSINGGNKVAAAKSTGRAASLYYVLKVNGGETISISQHPTGTTITYALKEFTASPLTIENITSNGQKFSAWLDEDCTLKANTQYVLIGFKNGDGSADFDDDQMEQLKYCLTIN